MNNALYKSRNLVFLLLLGSAELLLTNTTLAQTQSISGTTCVANMTQYRYRAGIISGSMTWTVSGGYISSVSGSQGAFEGSITGNPQGAVYVTWTSAAQVHWVRVASSSGTPTLNIVITSSLTPGTITSGKTQTINYSTAPAAINCSAATGGTCTPTYNYQWQNSTDNVNYTNITNATGQNYTSGNLTLTTYFRRFVAESISGSTGYSDVATITVNPQLQGGSLSPASQDIFTGTSPATIGGSPASGGGCGGAYTYSWESSPDGTNFTLISGTASTYSPGSLSSTTYYRRKASCSGQTAYSTTAVVVVHNHLTAGTASPSSVTIAYNTSPGQLTATASTGGMCGSYSYQWQQSSDNFVWSDVGPAGSLTYTPGNLTTAMYYRLKSVCGSETANTNTITVQFPPFVAGSPTPTSQLTNIYTGAPLNLKSASASGGPCPGMGCYSYQWQQSPNGTSWSDISYATQLVYNPGAFNPTTTTYYRMKVTIGSQTAYSVTDTITTESSQLNGPVDCWIGQTVTYYFTGGNPTNYSWGVTSGGQIQGAYNQVANFVVKWVSSGFQTVTLNNGGTFITVLVNVHLSPLSPSFIGKPIQSLEQTASLTINTFPDGATGGNCVGNFSYQWQQSTDSINYTDIVGQTATSLTITPTQNVYYRRRVQCSGVTLYTDTTYIALYPYFNPGAITSGNTDSIGWNTVPAMVSGNAPTGGIDSVYRYQWEYSWDGVNFQSVSNLGDGTNYQPADPVATKIYYRRRVTNGVTTRYTNTVLILVKIVKFDPGTISPYTLVINSGGSPSLTGTAANGGTVATYSYQWQQSSDEVNWKPISGATSLNYSPGALSRTIYYRRYVTNGAQGGFANVTGFFNVIKVKVLNGVTGTNAPTTATKANADPSITAIPINSYSLSAIAPNKINYIRTWDVFKPGITTLAAAKALTVISDYKQSTTYFDDLGREIQTVAKQATADNQDLISVMNYDLLGRVVQQYLPYSDSVNSGNFRTDANVKQPAFYNTMYNNLEGFYYNNTFYEPSPMNRVMKATAAGNSWTGNNIGVRTDYTFNGTYDSVKIWTIGNNITDVPAMTGSYASGTLAEIVTTDEHENKVIEFKDMEGKTILKKVELSDTLFNGYTGWLSTYYVYDVFDHLRYVIPPKAVQYAAANGWTLSTTVQNELCFWYNYDQEGRMITKKVPGAGRVDMVYDARDRLVMSQDSALRLNGQWIVTAYDSLDRPISTTLWNDGNTRAFHQNLAQSSVTYPAVGGTYAVLTESFYDGYGWQSRGDININHQFTSVFNNFSDLPVLGSPYSPTELSTAQTRGLATGSRVKVLDPLNNNLYLPGANFYDDYNRPLQQQVQNVTTGWDTVTTRFDFSSKIISTCAAHSIVSAVAPVKNNKISTAFNYDLQGRVTQVNKYLNGSTTPETIATNVYDKLGRLKNKTLGSLPVETLAYEYTIRGWLKGFNRNYVSGAGNSNFFGMDIGYDYGYSLNQLNGNIAGISWKSKGNPIGRAYGFGYDNTNRILKGDYTHNNGSGYATDASVNFSVDSLRYDANGNILSMNQKGLLLNTSALIDRLAYTYQQTGFWSNKLAKVVDGTGVTAPLGDFKDGVNGGDDYAYDGNGNLTIDNNKKITGIIYNFLNLPQKIAINGKGTISYIYDAAGNKLKKITVDSTSGVKTTTTTYTGPYIYNNDTLQIIGHEEGRLRYVLTQAAVPTHYAWDYFIKDHLGNIRMVLTEEGQTDMYPALTMEAANRVTEQTFYGPNPLSGVEAPKPSGYDTDTSNHTVVRLNYTDPARRIGPGILLKVMATDTVDIRTDVFYKSVGQNNNNSHIVSEMITGLIAAFGGNSGALDPTGKYTIGQRNGTSFTSSGYPNIDNLKGSDPNTNAGKPKAYMNWILFDEQFNLVNSSSGTRQVNSNADVKGTMTELGKIMNTNGYLYVYLSNEGPMDVFFDNFQVTHHRGRILEETHYYPFGLTMAGISSKALKTNYAENKKKFVSQELDDDLGLNWYQFRFRNHDPQIGRFLQIDPLADEYEYNSTYAYAENRPTTGIDLEGLEFFDLVKEVFWDNGIVPVVNFFNENLNPIVPAAELVTGKSYQSEFTEDKSRIESTGELMMTVIPAGKVEGTAAKSLEKAVVKEEFNQGEKQILKGAESKLVEPKEINVNTPYKRPNNATIPAQRASVQDKPCVTCGQTKPKMVANHKDILVKQHYEKGGVDKGKMRSNDAVEPQCPTCSAKQGAEMSRYSKQQKKKHGF